MKVMVNISTSALTLIVPVTLMMIQVVDLVLVLVCCQQSDLVLRVLERMGEGIEKEGQ